MMRLGSSMRQVENQALTEQNPYGVKHRFSVSAEAKHDGLSLEEAWLC